MNKEQNEFAKFRKYLLRLSLYPPKLKIKIIRSLFIQNIRVSDQFETVRSL